MKFIRLTKGKEKTPVYIVPSEIVEVRKSVGSDESFVFTNACSETVNEAPEQILALIEKCEKAPVEAIGQERAEEREQKLQAETAKAKAWDAIAPYLTQVSAGDYRNRLYLSGGYFNLSEKDAETIQKALEKKEGGK